MQRRSASAKSTYADDHSHLYCNSITFKSSYSLTDPHVHRPHPSRSMTIRHSQVIISTFHHNDDQPPSDAFVTITTISNIIMIVVINASIIIIIIIIILITVITTKKRQKTSASHCVVTLLMAPGLSRAGEVRLSCPGSRVSPKIPIPLGPAPLKKGK